MKTEWTQAEYAVAMKDRDELFPGYAEDDHPEVRETAEKMLEILCQRNRLLAALKMARDPYVLHMYNAQGSRAGIDQIDEAIASCKQEETPNDHD